MEIIGYYFRADTGIEGAREKRLQANFNIFQRREPVSPKKKKVD